MPPLTRFPSGPNNNVLSPYHQQFPHGQHSTNHPPPLSGNPGYLNPNSQGNPFSANSNLLGLAGGLNAGGGFSDTGLASHAARMGFHTGGLQQQQPQPQQQQHGAQHAQHSQHSQASQQHVQAQQGHGLVEHTNRAQKSRIREVWKHNLHEEMATLRDLVDKYPYIAMV